MKQYFSFGRNHIYGSSTHDILVKVTNRHYRGVEIAILVKVADKHYKGVEIASICVLMSDGGNA